MSPERPPQLRRWRSRNAAIYEQLLDALLEADRDQHEALVRGGYLSGEFVVTRELKICRSVDANAVLLTVLRLIDEAVADAAATDDGARRATGT